MSNRIKLAVQKTLATVTMTSTVLGLAGFAALTPVTALAVAPADYGLMEGDVISAAGSSDPDVYIVNEHGYKRLFVNPAIFNLYGHLGWNKVKTVSPATRDAFVTSGLFRVDGDQKVYGLDVVSEDVANLRWVNTSGAQAVADDANFFKKVFVINAGEKALYGTGADYTSVNQVPVYSRGGNVPAQTGSVTVGLASDNPASSTLVKNQGRADLAHFIFSGSGAVTSLKFKRLGVSADGDLDNVYLYDGSKRLTDAAGVSNGEISFNDTAGLFTVSGSKVISVRADLDASSTGQTIGVQAISVNGNTVSVSGNLHTVANATLSTVSLTDNTDPAANSDLVPANDVVGWRQTVTANTRYAWLRSIQLRVIGSVLPGDLKNFRLYLAGSQIGSAVSQPDANGYVAFDFGSGIKLDTGSRELKVLVDVVNGSGRNFTLSFRQASDIDVVDSDYNAGIRATSSSSFPTDGGQQTISSGSLTVTKKTNSPAGDVVKDASGVALARFEFKATGEKMKVENLRAYFDESDNNVTELRNGAIFADDGMGGAMSQIGSTQDITETSTGSGYTEYSLGSSLIVEPGKPRIVEIRSDIADGDGSDSMTADETLTAGFVVGSSNVQRLTTLDYVNSEAEDGNQLTIKVGTLTIGKYSGYANQSIVSPSNGIKVGHFTLTTTSAEDVNVNTINVDSDDSSGTFTAADLTNVYLKVLNDVGSAVFTSSTKSTISASASNSYSTSFTIPKNKVYQVEVWANVGSGITAGHSMNVEIDASGINVGSSSTATATEVNGQTITAQTGSLTSANGSLPASRLINGGTTATVYQFTLTPTYDDFTLEEIYVDIPASPTASQSGAIANLFLKSGGATISTTSINVTTGSASFTGLNLALLQSGGTKTFSVDVQFSNVGVGSNDTGGSVTMRLDGLKYRNSAGSATTTNGLSTTTYGGNAFVLAKGYPTFTNLALPSTVLAPGTQTLFKTRVTATGGQIAWNDIVFTVASNSAAGTLASFKLFENGVDITGDATASDSHGGTTQRVEFVFATERVISSGASVDLELKVTVGGTLAANDSISTNITNPTGTTITTEDSTTQRAKTTSFVWTDQSAPSHSTTTDDWYTDGLVKTLAESQALTK